VKLSTIIHAKPSFTRTTPAKDAISIHLKNTGTKKTSEAEFNTQNFWKVTRCHIFGNKIDHLMGETLNIYNHCLPKDHHYANSRALFWGGLPFS